METILWLSMAAFAVGFWIAKSNDDQIENGPNPAKDYEEMIERMNDYNRSIGVADVETIETRSRKNNGL
jgi:hypothetical protein